MARLVLLLPVLPALHRGVPVYELPSLRLLPSMLNLGTDYLQTITTLIGGHQSQRRT